jgi:hypothetical protein
VHAAAAGLFLDGVTGLALGANEQHVLAAGHHVGDQLLRPHQALGRLADVDDVDHVALAVDVRLHLGIPPADAVAEVDAGIDERFDEFCLRLGHGYLFRAGGPSMVD